MFSGRVRDDASRIFAQGPARRRAAGPRSRAGGREPPVQALPRAGSEELSHERPRSRPRADLDGHPRRRRLSLRAARRLRSRRRHPLRLRARPRVAQPGDELDRAGLGRQRDLADPRRRRAARGLSARLRHHPAGGLFPDADHAAGAGLPRRRLRVPLSRRRASHLLGPRLLLRLGARRLRARAWCSAPSSRASRSTGGISPAARSTASPRSRCSPASR